MAEKLETIDGIARRLNRDAYYLALIDENGDSRDIYAEVQEITKWLDAQKIKWSLCMGFCEETVWIEGGPGCIFMDIHPEFGAEAMQRVEAHFMDDEGEPAIHGYVPAVMRIDVARKFANRDDSDFWENL